MRFIAMDRTDYRSLERICLRQAAFADSDAARRALQKLAEDYRRKADEQDRQQKP